MRKLLNVSSVLAKIVGVLLVIGGIWGIHFTYKNVAQEHITTSPDSAMPGRLVAGPFTLKAQADVIRMHVLKMTGGKTYAEMPQTIAKLDDSGKPVLDEKGQAVMVPNTAREIWVTATTLTTALNLGIVTYAFSALILLFGLISFLTGVVFSSLAKRY